MNAKKCAAYYAANCEKIRLSQKDWNASNPEKVRLINQRKRIENGDHLRAERRKHYRENSARYKAQSIARKKHVKQATPSWADMEKIAAFYVEAERLTKKTGIPHHVDHVYPLRGKTMCGLHVEGNLQILEAKANLKKSNRIEAPLIASPPISILGANCV